MSLFQAFGDEIQKAPSNPETPGITSPVFSHIAESPQPLYRFSNQSFDPARKGLNSLQTRPSQHQLPPNLKAYFHLIIQELPDQQALTHLLLSKSSISISISPSTQHVLTKSLVHHHSGPVLHAAAATRSGPNRTQNTPSEAGRRIQQRKRHAVAMQSGL